MAFEDDLLALEQKVLGDAAGDFFRAVAELRSMLATQAPGLVAKLINLAIPDLEQAAIAGVQTGYSLGGNWALESAAILPHADDNALGDARHRIAEPAPVHLTDPLVGLDALIRDAKQKAVILHSSGARIEEALAPVFGAATTARARVETQINAASNTASLTVGEAVRSPMVWEAERNACVYCLSLAGERVETAGDTFPPPDKYAEGAASRVTVQQPPLHGHCRCRLAILGDISYADALKREAQRSILRGYAMPSESNSIRIKAASRLLDRDPVAPKSVKAFARAAVKRGRFLDPSVPDGGPRLVVTKN